MACATTGALFRPLRGRSRETDQAHVSLIHNMQHCQSDKKVPAGPPRAGTVEQKENPARRDPPSLVSERGVPPKADKHPLATTFLTAPSAQRYYKKLIPHSKIALQA